MKLVNDFLGARPVTKVIIVLYIVVILYLVSVFIAMSAAAAAEPMRPAMPAELLPIRGNSWFPK